MADAQPRSEAADEPDLDALEAAVGHVFEDRDLLLTAVTHRSFAHEALANPCRDNEPLEFLGDAILSFVVACRLFRDHPGLDEGRLSKHKSTIEKSASLAEMARQLDLGSYVRLGRGERKSGGSRNDKILSDAFEAVVAAIYLDGGLPAAEAFVERTLGPRLAALDGANPQQDFKSALQELTQSLGLGSPLYKVVEESGPDHDKSFRVVVSIEGRETAQGVASTKRGAQQLAAERALEELRNRPAVADDARA